MKQRVRTALAYVSLVCLPRAVAETAILQLQVIEGEGAVQTAGARSSRPITIQVTDETGKPVEGAAVSFRLPEDQVTGLFSNALRSDIIVTGADGRASQMNIQWGAAPGPVRIRVTAAKDQARAGIVVDQYVSESVAITETKTAGRNEAKIGSSGKWKWVLIAAAAAGGGLAAGMARPNGSSSSTGSAGAVTAAPVQVGPPTITIGK